MPTITTDKILTEGRLADVQADIAATIGDAAAAVAEVRAELAADQATRPSGHVGYSTLAILSANLTPEEGTLAEVTNDPDTSNNITYLKVGASGVGSWEPQSDAPILQVRGDISDLAASVRSKIRSTAAGEQLADGGDVPAWGVVDRMTGLHLVYLDQALGLRNPVLDATLASLTGAAAIVINDAEPIPFGIVDKRTGYYLAYVDAAGAWQVPESAAASSMDRLTVQVRANQISVYQRASLLDPYLFTCWQFDRLSTLSSATPAFDYWGLRTVKQVTKESGVFADVFNWIANGVNDCVFSEAQSGNLSIDGGDSMLGADSFTAGSHGNEYSLGDPILMVDGVVRSISTLEDYDCTEMTLMTTSKVLRSRSPKKASSDAHFCEVTKVWTLTPAGLRERLRTHFVEQYTGYAYYPLVTVQNDDSGHVVTTQMIRSRAGAIDVVSLPNDGTDPDDGLTSVPGVDEVWMCGPNGGVSLKVMRTFVGAEAVYPDHGGVPGHRGFFCKVSDPGENKIYFTLGGTAGMYGGVTSSRAAAGDVWDREFTITIGTP